MVLVRYGLIYLAARLVTGFAGFAVIAFYTRLLDATAFGQLTLTMTGVALISMLIIEGPYLAMLRYLPEHALTARANVLWAIALPVAALCGLLALATSVIGPDHWRPLLPLSAALVAGTVVHRFQLTLAQGLLRPWQYALLGSGEALLELGFGIFLVIRGYGVVGALTGAAAGLLLVPLLNAGSWWQSWRACDPVLLKVMLRFGLPLSATAAFGWMTTYADRWVLASLRSTHEAGLYGAAYDLPLNVLGVPLMVMTLAGYPLTISAFAVRGSSAARDELRKIGALIVMTILPAAVGLVLLGPPMTRLFLGEEYRQLALALLPIFTSAIFIKALMVFASYGFFLAGRSGLALLAMAATAGFNLALNLMFDSSYGVTAAAWASLCSFAFGLSLSVFLLRGIFPVPAPQPRLVISVAIGIAAMSACLLPFYGDGAWVTQGFVTAVAALAYLATTFVALRQFGLRPLA